jgi:hypothetical protein
MDKHPYGLFIVQPGVYFDPVQNDKDGTYKTRGIPKRMVVEYKDEFMAGYKRIIETHDVKQGDIHLPFHLFVGIKQALARHNTKDLGKFVAYKDSETGQPGRRTSFEWATKRQPNPLPGKYSAETGLRTLPYVGTRGDRYGGRPIQTIPYSRDIGGLLRRDLERLIFDNQPDWVRTE